MIIMKPVKKFNVNDTVLYDNKSYIVVKTRWHVNKVGGAAYWQYAIWDDVVGGLEWYCDYQLAANNNHSAMLVKINAAPYDADGDRVYA